MKLLKKVQLQDAKELTNSQMKDIKGGNTPTSGSDCKANSCKHGQYCVIHTGTRPYSGSCVSGATGCYCETK